MIKKNRLSAWSRIFFSVRTRILAWYVVLMIVSTLVSSIAIRQLLFVRIQEEVEESIIHEVEELRRVDKETNRFIAQSPRNGIAKTFNIFLAHNIPHDDTFFITLLSEKFYKSSPEVLPSSLQPDSELIKYWSSLTEPETGKKVTPTDTIFYVVEPLTDGKTRGVFVVAYSVNGEYKEVDRVVVVIFEVTIVVLAIASLLAWLVAGKILAPLRLLTETAHSISESDLLRRTPEQGVDEIGELTITFNRMLDRIQTAFTNQRDFINDAGHELRTPITIIRGHLELLGDDPQERRETIELVTDELDRMSRFVDDLLLLAKAEQPDFLNLETVDIGLLTEELYTKAKALASRKWHLENKGSGRIIADRHRLTQAIMNLAQNATQHTRDGDIITLGSAIKNNNAYFWVKDTGVGIAVADRQRIFERFARGYGSRRRSEGAGLGLSIVQAIALAHSGWVELESQPGEGSTFTIVIPLDPPQEVVSG